MTGVLKEKIKSLIELGYEGEYWDLKEKWHDDNGKLVHDILCFANTFHDHDCYIIVGVSDLGEIKGLEEHEKKKQANLIDMLRNISFAGDRPKVFLKSLLIDGKFIDVLIIPNSINVPYFLRKPYRKVKEGYIYTRTGDSNTPINQNSSISTIESLWKKRFGFNKTGLERFSHLLKDKDNWNSNDYGYYHTLSPEYAMKYKFSDSLRETISEFYSYVMYSEHTSVEQIELEVNGTVLKEIELITLDSGRYTTPSPEWGYIKFNFNDVFDFKYFIVDDLRYNLHSFFIDEESEDGMIAYKNFMEVTLTFKNSIEKEDFVNFVYHKEADFKNKLEHESKQYFKTDNEIFQRRIVTARILKQMLEEFRG
ncbi:ATP-binding protein [Bacillus licheniformis]|uniref:ATP-binding protein n=2 Tax=Bacillus TaxID=1386 RepID=A0AB37GNN4_BACLI|nr:ATP-binding protein [Bacillus licheniformis]MBW7632585.1 ATP-binding protein [Bacillus licheniformis]MDH3163805.1 ATP-binding protein [Bacillus licheniformis]MED4409598.1 ATP-binding protein [Bacillus licheniformis]QDL80033.1 ATP-binding protein [Bacillus licheniformis]QPR71096.1 ATP-binding protein [Bacillus licheniformis]